MSLYRKGIPALLRHSLGLLALGAMALTAACGGGAGGSGGGGGGGGGGGPVAPTITTQPSNQTVNDGLTATFTVVANGGSLTPTYQWKRGSTNISGATSASYTTPALTLADSGASYSVVASTSAGSVTSNSASVTVNAINPTIKTQPVSQSVNDGATATFLVVASAGSSAVTYQWKKGTTDIAGATQDSYHTPTLKVSDSGTAYSVVVSNAVGNATSNSATVTVNAIAPTITTQPSNQTVNDGLTATFTVVANGGSLTPTYQWKRGSTNISGATSASYTTPTLVPVDTGASYSVLVSTSAGSVLSNVATLTVNPVGGPTISPSGQPADAAAILGATATFAVSASSASVPLTYQWRKNLADILGATASSYTTPALGLADNGNKYSVLVTDSLTKATLSSEAKLTVTHTLALLAGKLGGAGNIDGTGSAAAFHYPAGIAIDSLGNIYVADTASQTIRKVSPANVVTTFAGTPNTAGYVDLTGTNAKFNNPRGLAVDSSNNIYVADSGNNLIRKITSAGVVSTFAGIGTAGTTNGDAITVATFNGPRGVAVDSLGNVFVADTDGNVIRKISAGSVSTLSGTGIPGYSGDGTTVAQFNGPTGVAVDASGNIYVADWLNNVIRQVTALTGVVTTLAGSVGNAGYGEVDGIGGAAKFNGPVGLSIDAAGANLFVSDYNNNALRGVAIPTGVVTTLAGSTTSAAGSTDATGTAARFTGPASTVVDSTSGNVYVVDLSNNLIRKFDPVTAAVTTVAGNIGGRGYVDGLGGTGAGAAALFSDPAAVASDSTGNLYVADYHNNVIRKIDVNGIVSTLAGNGSPGFANGTGNTAQFNGPNGIAVDSLGNVYVADSVNFIIRKITPAGVVSTFAGTLGTPGSADGTGTAAQFYHPYSVATDSSDNVYVADFDNDTIRKITSAGVVSTVAGTAGQAGSSNSPALFYGPRGIATDAAGNIYVAESGSHTIRKITMPAGTVTTLAGTPLSAGYFDGTGSAAFFNTPSGVAVDSADNVYVADYENHAIRMVTPAGVVTTVAGVASQLGVSSGVSTGLVSLPGTLNGPTGVVVMPGSTPTLTKVAVAEDTENSVLLLTLP